MFAGLTANWRVRRKKKHTQQSDENLMTQRVCGNNNQYCSFEIFFCNYAIAIIMMIVAMIGGICFLCAYFSSPFYLCCFDVWARSSSLLSGRISISGNKICIYLLLLICNPNAMIGISIKISMLKTGRTVADYCSKIEWFEIKCRNWKWNEEWIVNIMKRKKKFLQLFHY